MRICLVFRVLYESKTGNISDLKLNFDSLQMYRLRDKIDHHTNHTEMKKKNVEIPISVSLLKKSNVHLTLIWDC